MELPITSDAIVVRYRGETKILAIPNTIRDDITKDTPQEYSDVCQQMADGYQQQNENFTRKTLHFAFRFKGGIYTYQEQSLLQGN